MKSIALLGADLTTGNMGVGALAMGAIKIFDHAWPEAKQVLFDYGRTAQIFSCRVNGRTVSVEVANIRFSKNPFLSNHIAFLIAEALVLRAIPWKKAKQFLLRKNARLRMLSEADLVASVAGGDSFSDIYGFGRFFYVVLPQIFAVILNKKLVLMPQTLGPFQGFLARSLARFVMNRSERIYSRDHAGIVEMRRLLNGGKGTEALRFSYDMGFVLDPVKPDVRDWVAPEGHKKEGRRVIGVNVSGLLLAGGYNGKNMFGLKADYEKIIHEIIRRLLSMENAIVWLVPHVFGEIAESDSSACKAVFNKLQNEFPERIFSITGNFGPAEIKYVIGQCDFFVGSRMHACIAALSQNIPAIGLAYSRKFAGVMQSIGMDSLVADPRHLDIEGIWACIQKALADRDHIREKLAKKMPVVKAAVIELFAHNGL